MLRLKPGTEIEMVGEFGLAPAVVSTVDFNKPFSRKNPGLAVHLSGPWKQCRPDGPRLALALIQGQRFDWAVEKSVELGAVRFIPLISERCKSADAKPGPTKRERWRRLAESAQKQCGRENPMEISAPHTVTELLERFPGPGFFLSPTAQNPVSETDLAVQPSPLLIVGPEGGFSPIEEHAFSEVGFSPLGLGSTVLRAETAALAILSILMVN